MIYLSGWQKCNASSCIQEGGESRWIVSGPVALWLRDVESVQPLLAEQ